MPSLSDEQLVTVLRHLAESSVLRSKLSAERSYQNAERTLSLLVHSAAALMVLGLSVADYLLFVHGGARHLAPMTDVVARRGGAVMVALATLAVLAGGLRYLPYVKAYYRNRGQHAGAGAFLAPAYALAAGVCGIATLVFMMQSGV